MGWGGVVLSPNTVSVIVGPLVGVDAELDWLRGVASAVADVL